MNPKRVSELQGVRLAFAQGGKLGTRLVFLTPPIYKTKVYQDRSEVLWKPHLMPFRYERAPMLIDNNGNTDFKLLKSSFKKVLRSSWVAKFSSKFRSRREVLENAQARELIQGYESHRSKCGQKSIANNYVEALPMPIGPASHAEREEKYEKYCEEAGRPVATEKFPCG
jgi:hypothetical protein